MQLQFVLGILSQYILSKYIDNMELYWGFCTYHASKIDRDDIVFGARSIRNRMKCWKTHEWIYNRSTDITDGAMNLNKVYTLLMNSIYTMEINAGNSVLLWGKSPTKFLQQWKILPQP